MNGLSILDSIFGGNFACDCGEEKSAFCPAVDVKETSNSYLLEMELPGKTEKDVEISIKDNVLTISSVKNNSEVTDKNSSLNKENTDNEKWLLHERDFSDFKRHFEFPKDADFENVSASLKNGILFVSIAKKQASSARKIVIEAA